MSEAIEPTFGTPRFQLSVDVQILAEMLRATAVGEIVSYAVMSAKIKRDVQGKARHILASARRMVLRDAIVFDAVTGVGVKRLSDSECVQTWPKTLKHVGRSVRRASRIIACAKYEGLSNADRVQHNGGLAVMGTFGHMAKPVHVKSLESRAGGLEPIALSDTLEMFKPK